ncbi:hypothetical protein Forpe1208_v014155 [Fusarium oxysporum f. sp. rapae]|uniref:Uncharacterized protein n=1 Tax=Fusarium oxysporum f. sp. rapae TaxID=485398 RepID=A0A8J5TQG3_FUSOX|nr:hypothetical protein Forpe1208_v014155 [Fusarium oxysporum f. sp. rapae]
MTSYDKRPYTTLIDYNGNMGTITTQQPKRSGSMHVEPSASSVTLTHTKQNPDRLKPVIRPRRKESMDQYLIGVGAWASTRVMPAA